MARNTTQQGAAPPPRDLGAALILVLLCASGCADRRDTSQGRIYGGGSRVIKLDASADSASAGGTTGAGGGTTDAGDEARPPGQSAACAMCEKEQCTTDDFIHSNRFALTLVDPDQTDDDLYDLCYPKDPASTHATDLPSAGPAAGSGITKAELCREVIGCIRSTGCSFLTTGVECYCGTQSSLECAKPGLANGPCKGVFESAVEETSPVKVLGHMFDLPQPGSKGNALGYALTFLGACETRDPMFISGNWDPPCANICASGADAGTAGTDAAEADGGAGASGGGQAAGGTTGTGGAAGTGGTGSGDGGGSACVVTHSLGAGCAACELAASSLTKCLDPALFSAKSMVDDDGNAKPDGFGPDTLPTKAQQDAAYALIGRIKSLLPSSVRNATNTQNAAPGSEDANVQNGLLEPGASNTSFTFFDPMDSQLLPPSTSALNEYKAAAVADAAGPRGAGLPPGLAGSPSDANIASYISGWATHPKSALGLVDNILTCAVNAEVADPRCLDCFEVSTKTECESADGAADAGAAGTSGAAGSVGAAGSGVAGNGVAGSGSAGSGSAGSGEAGSGVAGSGVAGSGGSAGSGSGGSAGGAGTGGAGASAPCPDLNHDAIPDCQQTLVTNGTFDDAATSWTAAPGSTASWTSRDGDGRAASGAIAVTNLDTSSFHATNGWTTVGASQCLAVTAAAAAHTYEVAGQAYLPGGQGGGAAQLILGYSLSADCADKPFPLSFFSPLVMATDSWQTITGTTTQIPDGVLSVSVRLVASKPVGQPSLEVLFDNVLVRVK